MFHGTPEYDDIYLLESVRDDGEVVQAADEEIAARLGANSGNLILCGHSHIPRSLKLFDTQIVNPGSVGLQAYSDDRPVPHVMETGSPQARYAVIKRLKAGWSVELVMVRYDVESASRVAERNGRPDWAWRLRTCRATPQISVGTHQFPP